MANTHGPSNFSFYKMLRKVRGENFIYIYTYVYTYIYTGIFAAALFVISKNWRLPTCPGTGR